MGIGDTVTPSKKGDSVTEKRPCQCRECQAADPNAEYQAPRRQCEECKTPIDGPPIWNHKQTHWFCCIEHAVDWATDNDPELTRIA